MKVLFVVIPFCFYTICSSNPITAKESASLFLQKYGYLGGASSSHTSSIMSEKSVLNALKDFQRFVGLEETGQLDSATISMMNRPRCGVKDIIGHSELARRRKRYAHQGSRWRVKRLTYRISKFPTKFKDKQIVKREMSKAFKVWSDVTNLSFEERPRGRVNIEIRFEEGEHGDGDPFDGPGNSLGHAFFPQMGGDVHFDNDETWTIDDLIGTNLFQVGAHEIGHSLGLAHSDEKDSLMVPYHRGYDPGFRLHKDDIDAIQSIYGKIAGSSTPGSEKEPVGGPTDVSDAPDLCQEATIDTITRTKNGSCYAFRGEFYWKVLEGKLADGYPRRISEDWGGLEGDLDASLTWANGKTFFFKGRRYWRFINRKMDEGYPKLMSAGFEGIPERPDAAFVWSGNGKTYFFKGDKYWRFDSHSDPPVSDKFPRPISNWKGIPNNIDAAIQWDNGKTYFLKGDEYYRFNDADFEVDKDPVYPLRVAEHWFGCKSMSQKTQSPPNTNEREHTTPPGHFEKAE